MSKTGQRKWKTSSAKVNGEKRHDSNHIYVVGMLIQIYHSVKEHRALRFGVVFLSHVNQGLRQLNRMPRSHTIFYDVPHAYVPLNPNRYTRTHILDTWFQQAHLPCSWSTIKEQYLASQFSAKYTLIFVVIRNRTNIYFDIYTYRRRCTKMKL